MQITRLIDLNEDNFKLWLAAFRAGQLLLLAALPKLTDFSSAVRNNEMHLLVDHFPMLASEYSRDQQSYEYWYMLLALSCTLGPACLLNMTVTDQPQATQKWESTCQNYLKKWGWLNHIYHSSPSSPEEIEHNQIIETKFRMSQFGTMGKWAQDNHLHLAHLHGIARFEDEISVEIVTPVLNKVVFTNGVFKLAPPAK